MSSKLEGFVAKLTALGGGSGTSLDIYEDWAPTYERNLQEDYGYVAHQIAADVFVRFQSDKSVRVLDLACGTGLVGQVLFDRGFANIDGLDVSPSMLAEAKKKQVYGDLLTGDVSLPLELGGRRYQAAIAVGCFGGGHLGPEHLINIIDCVEPGGVVVLYLNGIPYVEDNYNDHLRSLEGRGVCQLLCQEQSNYMQGFERPGWSVALTCTG